MKISSAQYKLIWSWLVGGLSLLLAAYLINTQDSYVWLIPMFIGMSVVKYLRHDIDYEVDNLFHCMSEIEKRLVAVYLLVLIAVVIYFLLSDLDVVGNNVGVFLILTLAPFFLIGAKLDLQLFRSLGTRDP